MTAQQYAARLSELSRPREACDFPWRTRNNAHHVHTCAYEDPHPEHDMRHVCLCGAVIDIER